MKSQTTRFVGLICLFITAATGSTLAAARAQTPPPSAPSDADIFRTREFLDLDEPLVPIGVATTPEENIALAKAIDSYAKRDDLDDHSALLNFLSEHPKSPWRAAILTNIGIRYRQTGWFLKALAAWEEAWQLGKDETSRLGKPLADRAIGELAALNTVLGRKAEVEAILKDLGDRPLMGPATEKVTLAREGLWFLRHEPENVLKCGPYALAQITVGDDPRAVPHPDIVSAKATDRGTSLEQVWKLSRQAGMNYQMAKRKPGAKVIIPSVVNWKANHFAAIVGEEQGKFRVKDPTSRRDLMVSKAALDEETSGYSLVPAGPLPKGWSHVGEAEGRRVWGAGGTTEHVEGTKPWDDKAKQCPSPAPAEPPSGGMPTYNFHTQQVSLNIMDTPVGYTPPLGPDMHFTITYNQREVVDSGETISNFGSKWVCNWIAHTSRLSPNGDNANINLPGGGSEYYGSLGGQDRQSGAILTLTGDIHDPSDPAYYTRTLPDGSYQIFRVLVHSHRFYMTQWTDAQGNTVLFHYNGFRLTSVTDALGQPTLIEHRSDDPNDLLDYYLIRKITDPFGGYAEFEYNDDRQLVSIRDAVGIVSTFEYHKTSDFVQTMTTPYATTHFSQPGSNLWNFGVEGNARVIQAEDDETGDIERVEFGHFYPCDPPSSCVAPEIVAEEPPSALPAPAPIPMINGGYRLRNTFYWDKKTTRMYPPRDGVYDYTKAKLIHWLHVGHGFFETIVANIKEREKMPLENAVYYFYPGQSDNRFRDGVSDHPSAVGQVLGDGTTAFWKYEYNSRHNVIQMTDPEGRVTNYEYAANEVDLIAVYQRNPAGESTYPPGFSSDKIYGCTYYPNTRLRHIVTNAAGQPTIYTYNARNQIETVTNARGEPTTYTYGTTTSNDVPLGYLASIISPPVSSGSASTNFTYENGRARTLTSNPDGYVITIESDHLNRPTQVAYLDGTTEEFKYTRHNEQNVDTGVMTLDLTASKDRLNRWTYRHYTADRQMSSITDPANRTTTYAWCSCGTLESITDPKQQITTFYHDVQGRVYQKVFANYSTINYLFDGQSAPNTPGATSRLKSSTDALNRRTNYTYFRDGNLKRVCYTNTSGTPLTPPTPTVNFTYDPNFNRIATMNDDENGETTYTYNNIGNPPFVESGTLAQIAGPLENDTISFLHDELGRIISQTIEGGGESTAVYDALGRLTTSGNPLGQFGRTYYGPTSRLDTLTYPNGQTTHFTYYGNTKDRRLQTLQSRDPQTLNLSKFDYDYHAGGEILSWARQLGNANSGRWFAYDAIQRLLSSRNHLNPILATEVNNYGYDDAGNRTSDATSNSQNPFGTISHTYTPNNLNQIESFATNQGPISGEDVPLAYDLAGNLIDDGQGKSFDWDAANRLTAINFGRSQRTQFYYDGLNRRVKIVETTGSNVTSTKHFVWVGNTIAQELDGDGKVTRQYFAEGEQREKSHFYTRDHLGSIREMTDGEGTLEAQYDYDPYGQRTKLAGTEDVDFGYTGHYHHAPSGLNLTLYRAYNPAFGRWLSRDPIGEAGGVNLYEYVQNSPLRFTDQLGLAPGDWWDARTWFNRGLTDSLSNTWTSLQDATGDILNGNWDRLPSDAAGNPLGQTENCPAAYNTEVVLLGVSGASALGTVPVGVWASLSPGARLAILNALANALHPEGSDPIPRFPRLPPRPPPGIGGR